MFQFCNYFYFLNEEKNNKLLKENIWNKNRSRNRSRKNAKYRSENENEWMKNKKKVNKQKLVDGIDWYIKQICPL